MLTGEEDKDEANEKTVNIVDVPRISEFVARGIVSVKVGTEHRELQLHKALLEHHSEYFKGALSGAWGGPGGIIFDDVQGDIFGIFVNWLYTQKLPKNREQWRQIVPCPGRIQYARIQACILGDRLLVPSFRSAINRQIVNLMGSPLYKEIILAYGNLPNDYPMLDYLVDIHCYRWKETQEKKGEELSLRSHLPVEFLIRVMKKYASLQNLPRNKWPAFDHTAYYEVDNAIRDETNSREQRTTSSKGE